MTIKSFLLLRKCHKNDSIEILDRDKNVNYLLDKGYILPGLEINKDLSDPIWWSYTDRYYITQEGIDAYFKVRHDIFKAFISIIGILIALIGIILQII